MIIFPAIDIMDGKPVRLLRGDFDTAEQVAEDVPVSYTHLTLPTN